METKNRNNKVPRISGQVVKLSDKKYNIVWLVDGKRYTRTAFASSDKEANEKLKKIIEVVKEHYRKINNAE